MITHVVILWTDKGQDELAVKMARGAEELLSGIPEARNLRIGQPVSSPRGTVDESYAVALSMDFENQAAADTYQTHPKHVEFVEKYVKPYAKRTLIYDFAPRS